MTGLQELPLIPLMIIAVVLIVVLGNEAMNQIQEQTSYNQTKEIIETAKKGPSNLLFAVFAIPAGLGIFYIISLILKGSDNRS